MAIGAILSAGASILGGVFQGNAANKAARAQEGMAREQMALYRDAQEQQTNALAPFLRGGTTANDAYLYELGLGPRPTVGGTPAQINTIAGTSTGGGGGVSRLELNMAKQKAESQGGQAVAQYQRLLQQSRQPARTTPTMYEVSGQRFSTMEDAQAFAAANPVGGTAYGGGPAGGPTGAAPASGFTKTPGYDFRMAQGMDALESSAAARGRLFSGATMEAATEFGQDYATSQYEPFMNRLEGLSGRGQNAAAGQGVIIGQGASNIGNALGSIGDARSAGFIAKGNAMTDGIDNAISAYSYFNNQRGTSGGTGDRAFAGGGSSGGYTTSPFVRR